VANLLEHRCPPTLRSTLRQQRLSFAGKHDQDTGALAPRDHEGAGDAEKSGELKLEKKEGM
jgi:hypothetical protein